MEVLDQRVHLSVVPDSGFPLRQCYEVVAKLIRSADQAVDGMVAHRQRR